MEKALYIQFNEEFWRFFLGSELAQNRKGVAFEMWAQRTRVARKAMFCYLQEHGAPKENPFFWAKRFPDPTPTNYNGSPDLNRMAATCDMVVALYNGAAGIYTRQDAEDYEMTIKRPFQL